MNEKSQTLLPGAAIYKPHHETGVMDQLSFAEEALRANLEATKQSTKKVKQHD